MLASKLLRKWYVRVPIEVAAILLLWFFVIQVRPTSGPSMLPGLKEGAYVFVDKLSYRFREPARGDVVVFEANEKPPILFCKRVIALPGEVVEIRKGQVLVNDLPLYEPYTISNRLWNLAPVRVAKHQVYAVGDNRGMAMVRHFQGVVPYRSLLGRVIGKGHKYDP